MLPLNHRLFEGRGFFLICHCFPRTHSCLAHSRCSVNKGQLMKWPAQAVHGLLVVKSKWNKSYWWLHFSILSSYWLNKEVVVVNKIWNETQSQREINQILLSQKKKYFENPLKTWHLIIAISGIFFQVKFRARYNNSKAVIKVAY